MLIVPMRYNDEVVAVIELAGFYRYEPYEINFVEKMGEIMAASIISAQSNERMQLLLAQTRFEAEQMCTQEEEMRQNTEELEATQEEMRRRKTELNQRINQLDTNIV